MLGVYDALVFDLDGTLVDSAPVLKQILNGMRGERGLPPLTIETYRAWSSEGGSALIARSMEIDETRTAEDLSYFRESYEKLPTPVESVYPGVRNFLNEASKRCVKLGVCTNKPGRLSQKVLVETKLCTFFKSVISGDSLLVKKPDPTPLLEVITRLGVDKNKTLYVGDSGIDHKTAIAAGVDFLLFKSGYDVDHESKYQGDSFFDYQALRWD